MQQPSDEIKSKLDIIEVIREYIPIKPAGVNFRALCPFHREKTPSFVVSPEKQIWHCFGCSEGGDIFTFVMKMEGLSFVEALRMLASKAGVTLRRQDPKLTTQRNRLLDILEISAKYYHKILTDNNEAKSVRQYLEKRNLIEDSIQEWQIGYSPDSWDDIIKILQGKGYNENEIFLAGMSIKKEGTGRFYNRFRGRVMFPICNVNGNIVAFSARVRPDKEEEEKLGKYINSPQTMIYDKSKILFGLDKAKMAIKNQDLAIVVEGQMDVITAHQHGFKNVIATSGTALTINQINILKRYTENFTFALDFDTAGQMAIDRADSAVSDVDYNEIEGEDRFGNIRKYINPHSSYQINRNVIIMPEGKDPDELIREDIEAWKRALVEARPMMQYYFNKTFVNLNLDDVSERRKAAKILMPIISRLGNKIEQDFWLKKLSQKIDVAENILKEALDINHVKKNITRDESAEAPTKIKARMSRQEMLAELLLALAIKFPFLLEYVINNIYIDQIAGVENKLIYKNLIIYYNSINSNQSPTGENTGEYFNYKSFRDWLKKDLSNNEAKITEEKKIDNQLNLLNRLVLLGDRDFYELDNEQAKTEIIKIISDIKKLYLRARMKEIENFIIQSEKDGVIERAKELLEELKTLGEELREL